VSRWGNGDGEGFACDFGAEFKRQMAPDNNQDDLYRKLRAAMTRLRGQLGELRGHQQPPPTGEVDPAAGGVGGADGSGEGRPPPAALCSKTCLCHTGLLCQVGRVNRVCAMDLGTPRKSLPDLFSRTACIQNC